MRILVISLQISIDNQGEDVNYLFDAVIKEPKLVIIFLKELELFQEIEKQSRNYLNTSDLSD